MKTQFAIFLILFFMNELVQTKKLEYTFETQGPSKKKKNSKKLKRRQKRKLEIKQKHSKKDLKKRKLLDFKKLLMPIMQGAAAGAIPAMYHKFKQKTKEKYLNSTLTQQQEVLNVMQEDDQILFDTKLDLQKALKKIVAVQQSLVFRMDAKDDAILELMKGGQLQELKFICLTNYLFSEQSFVLKYEISQSKNIPELFLS